MGAQPRPGRVDITGAGLSHRAGLWRRMYGGSSGARAHIPTDVPTTQVSPQGATRTFLGGQNAHFTGLDHFGAGTKPRVQQRTPQASSRQRASSLSRGPTTTPSACLQVSDSARERHTCVCISGTRDTMARPRRGRARFLTIPTYENTRLDVQLYTLETC